MTVNADDPLFFATDLVEELARVAAAFELGPEEVLELVLAGIDAAFLPAERRRLRARCLAAAEERGVGLPGGGGTQPESEMA